MENKIYYRAQKFLKLRASGGDPMTALEDLEHYDREEVKDFLKRNHQVKFL